MGEVGILKFIDFLKIEIPESWTTNFANHHSHHPPSSPSASFKGSTKSVPDISNHHANLAGDDDCTGPSSEQASLAIDDGTMLMVTSPRMYHKKRASPQHCSLQQQSKSSIASSGSAMTASTSTTSSSSSGFFSRLSSTTSILNSGLNGNHALGLFAAGRGRQSSSGAIGVCTSAAILPPAVPARSPVVASPVEEGVRVEWGAVDRRMEAPE